MCSVCALIAGYSIRASFIVFLCNVILSGCRPGQSFLWLAVITVMLRTTRFLSGCTSVTYGRGYWESTVKDQWLTWDHQSASSTVSLFACVFSVSMKCIGGATFPRKDASVPAHAWNRRSNFLWREEIRLDLVVTSSFHGSRRRARLLHSPQHSSSQE